MELKFNYDNPVAIVTIEGNLNASCSEDLKEKFQKSINKTNNYIMDLSGMDFVDSTGLGALVACLKYAVEKKGTIKIANLQNKPKMLFEITRVYRVFDIFDSVKAALESFKN